MPRGQQVRVRKAVPEEAKEGPEIWEIERERKGLELATQTGAKCLRDGWEPGSTGADRAEDRVREQRSVCGIQRKQVPPSQASMVLIQAPVRELRVRPLLPGLSCGPTDCPSWLPRPLTSCPSPGPTCRKDRRRPTHTLPTRPEINISRETELVL